MAYQETWSGKISRKLIKKLHIIDVAAGRKKADLVLKNATFVNVFSGELETADIAVAEGLIVGLGQYEGNVEADMTGKIVCPGFIDSHIHLESSLVTPSEFVRAVVPHGTTTVITDPHEITNVMGINGIDYNHSILQIQKKWVGKARRLGMSTNSWTVNKEHDMKAILKMKIDMLTTDNPLQARELMKEMGINEL